LRTKIRQRSHARALLAAKHEEGEEESVTVGGFEQLTLLKTLSGS
jgi:hypothetical protein